ncbi:MAG: ETC complex I subunit [Devosiaceae bacterium]|nr:ETC complex I subunit [Devosiaceae bacterium MH13]
MVARIYRPAKTAMQSGLGKTKSWVLEYVRDAPRTVEPLMGWTSSSDMNSQIKLTFETRDDAVAYATRNGIAYRVEEPKERVRRKVAYADNFRYDRRVPWTH